jgi:hypothetical protein
MTARKPRPDAELLAEIEAAAAWHEPRQADLDALGLGVTLLAGYHTAGIVKLTLVEFDALLDAAKGRR